MVDCVSEKMSKGCKKSVIVKCKLNKAPICVTEWSSNGIPVEGNKIEVSVSNDNNDLQLECRDPFTNVRYCGEKVIPKYEKYMVLVVEDDKATLKSCAYFRMKPQLDLPVRISGQVSSLSVKEQLDEINEKFGSKKIIRRIKESRKNAVSFGSEEYQTMKEQAAEMPDKSGADVDVENTDGAEKASKKKIKIADIYDDHSLIPPRNTSATSITEVYNIYDIVPQSLTENIATAYDLNDIKSSINCPLVEHFATKSKNVFDKACCIFLDAMIILKGLKPTALYDAEEKGIEGIKSQDLLLTLLNNYTLTTRRNERLKRVMDQKCKDKILIHSLILCIILNNFRPLLLPVLAQTFQTSLVKMKKYGNIIGCHVDINKEKTERVLVLRLPLYSMETEAKYKRRRAR